MTTLKQKIKLIIYHRFRGLQNETDEQITDRILKEFKKWLQQKPTYTKNQLSDDGSDSWIISSETKYYKKEELLKELTEKKENKNP